MLHSVDSEIIVLCLYSTYVTLLTCVCIGQLLGV